MFLESGNLWLIGAVVGMLIGLWFLMKRFSTPGRKSYEMQANLWSFLHAPEKIKSILPLTNDGKTFLYIRDHALRHHAVAGPDDVEKAKALLRTALGSTAKFDELFNAESGASRL